MGSQLVSVIIPVYNTEQFLPASLESVLEQSYDNLQIIIIDDGSTDSSADICKYYEQRDSRIQYINQKNAGASSARNQGLDVSIGEYVLFVDCDDWIDPGMISMMIRMADTNPEADIIQFQVPGDFKRQSREGLYSSQEAIHSLLQGAWWGPVCKLIRRSSIGDLRFPKRTVSEDYLFNYHLFSCINKLYYSNLLFYHRRVRDNSLSRLAISERKFDELYNVEEVFNRVIDSYPEYKHLAEVHLAGTCLKHLFSAYSSGSIDSFDSHIKHIFCVIRMNYFSILRNPHIPFRERVLLSTCFSPTLSLLSYRLYSFYKSN